MFDMWLKEIQPTCHQIWADSSYKLAYHLYPSIVNRSFQVILLDEGWNHNRINKNLLENILTEMWIMIKSEES